MRSFKDNQKDQWNLTLTLGKTRQLREKLGLDLLNPEHLLQISNSLTDRMAIVFLLAEPQAKERGIDADEFEERLYGENFVFDASEALLREAEDFFTRLGQPQMAMLAKKVRETLSTGRGKAMQLAADGSFDSLLSAILDPTTSPSQTEIGETYSSGPPSQGSTGTT